MPGLNDITDDPAKSTHNALSPELSNELSHRIDAILQRQHGCVWANERLHRARGLRHLPRLYAEEHEINFTNFTYIIRRFSRIDHEIAISTIHPESIRLDRAQMFATRNKRNVVAGVCQPAAEVPADTTCSKYCYSHRLHQNSFFATKKHKTANRFC